MENKRKHLELIQAVITRMASNLFFLKGWTITLIVALFAVLAKEANPNYIIIAYIPALTCWALDGYFLSQERLFRSLYNHVRKLKENEIDFSMDTELFKKDEKNSFSSCLFSKTLLIFYGSLIALMLIITFILIG